MNKEHLNTKWSRTVIKQRIPSATPTQLPPNPWRWVCVKCNDRLEKVFETPCRSVVEALLGRRKKLLLGRDQLLAARWLFKHTLVWGLTNPSDTTGLADEMRDLARECLEELFNHQEPNFAGSMRIAVITASKAAGLPLEPYTVGPVMNSRASFGEVSHLGWLMWESIIMPLEEEPDSVPVFAINQDERLSQIWPPAPGRPLLAWPPARPSLRVWDETALRQAWGINPDNVYDSDWSTDVAALLKEHRPGTVMLG